MVKIRYISEKVAELIQKYSTRDPFELCEKLNINIRYKDLGSSIKAFYFYQSRIKNIVINVQSEQIMRNILCAHELGHAVLHGDRAAMRGFQEIDLFDAMVPTEYEANLFAAELLIDEQELLENMEESKTFFDLAKELYVPPELLEFKFRLLQARGFLVQAPIIARSDFLKNSQSIEKSSFQSDSSFDALAKEEYF